EAQGRRRHDAALRARWGGPGTLDAPRRRADVAPGPRAAGDRGRRAPSRLRPAARAPARGAEAGARGEATPTAQGGEVAWRVPPTGSVLPSGRSTPTSPVSSPAPAAG